MSIFVIWTISSEEEFLGQKLRAFSRLLVHRNRTIFEKGYSVGNVLPHIEVVLPNENPSEGLHTSRVLQWSVRKQDQWEQPLFCPEDEEEVCFVNIRTKSRTTSSQRLQAWVNITSAFGTVNPNPGGRWCAELSGDPPAFCLFFLPWLQRYAELSGDSPAFCLFFLPWLQRSPLWHLCSDHCSLFPVLFLLWNGNKIPSFGE